MLSNGFLRYLYGKFVDDKTLKREYVQFSKSYFDFEKMMNLPEKFDDTNKDSWIQCDSDGGDDDIQYNKIDQNSKKNNSGTINTIFKICHLSGLNDIFPTMYTALSIAVTQPAYSASHERTFSKLKLVKNRLRSTIMSEDRLEALMLMACELDVQIDTECVIKYFGSNSAFLAKLLTTYLII